LDNDNRLSEKMWRSAHSRCMLHPQAGAFWRMAKPDRRTERTRAALMAAFVDLVLANGFDSLTVEEIAERADVGRSTFYMHFSGKDDILKKCMARVSMVLALIVGHEITSEILVPTLVHYREQRTRNRAFFVSPIRQLWVACLAELIEPRLAKLARIVHARPVVPLPMIALQLAEAQISLIVNWLLGRTTTKPEAIAEALIGSTRASLAAFLRCDPAVPLLIPGETLRVIGGPMP
jgi:AcrR family transcriptional regulator